MDTNFGSNLFKGTEPNESDVTQRKWLTSSANHIESTHSPHFHNKDTTMLEPDDIRKQWLVQTGLNIWISVFQCETTSLKASDWSLITLITWLQKDFHKQEHGNKNRSEPERFMEKWNTNWSATFQTWNTKVTIPDSIADEVTALGCICQIVRVLLH